MNTTVTVRPVSHLWQVSLIAGVYFVAARMSLGLAIPPGYATPVWPPSGIALAATLLLGGRIWPGVWIGAALVNLTVEDSFITAALVATGNTLEALVGGALIRRYVGIPRHFEHSEDVVKFIVLCALSPAIAATVALIPLALGHSLSWLEILSNWWTWWEGDVAGIIVITPLILSWSVRDAGVWPPQKKMELAYFGLLLLISATAILVVDSRYFAPFSLTFVSLPFIIWAAFRFGQREVATTTAVVCSVAIWYTVAHPDLLGSGSVNEWLLMLLTFICMVVVTGLTLVTVVGERGRTMDRLALEHIGKEEKLAYLAHYDVLTGLPNRALFHERLSYQLHIAERKKTKVTLFLGDVKRFRLINESLGRHAGDALLRELAARLKNLWPDPHNVARIAADCFTGILADAGDEADIVHLLEKSIKEGLSPPFKINEKELTVSMTVGIAVFPADGSDADTLFKNAEAALKKAKESGEHFLFYRREMNARVAEILLLENKMRRALDQQQFVLHYQPKIELATESISGLEALIRWNDPETGLVPPMQFIPLLEETGMILEAGRWAILEALKEYEGWSKQGLMPPRIAVNVSPIQLRQKGFVDVVRDALRAYGTERPGLDLEITESLIMEDIKGNIEKLRAIRDLGVNIAIDDFGTGYSSLGYLAKLPVNALKIDRSFIITMAKDRDSMNIVSTIISLAHTLNLKVVAEGVDSEEQSRLLKQLKCDEIQGYLFSKPLPAAQVKAKFLGAEI